MFEAQNQKVITSYFVDKGLVLGCFFKGSIFHVQELVTPFTCVFVVFPQIHLYEYYIQNFLKSVVYLRRKKVLNATLFLTRMSLHNDLCFTLIRLNHNFIVFLQSAYKSNCRIFTGFLIKCKMSYKYKFSLQLISLPAISAERYTKSYNG